MRLTTEAFWERLHEAMSRVPQSARQPPADARVGAVLALFADTDDGPELVLTRRRHDLRSHPGQLSFPGGRVDPGETHEEAALREAQEEIGLRSASVEVVGTGPTFFIPPSRFWVVPVVGRWHEPHPLTPNPWEVDEVLHVPLATLLEPERWRYVPMSDGLATWAWRLDEDLLWGATGMMVAALLDVVVDGWSQGLAPRDLGDDRRALPWEEHPAWEPRARLAGVPEVPWSAVPTVTASQAREVDRLLRDDARVGLPQLLEHVGRAVADAVRRLVGGDLGGVAVTVLAGPGGNGAGGAATARLLAAAGAEVEVVLVGEPRRPEVAAGLRAVGVGVVPPGADPEAGDLAARDVVVDAMLGVGARPPVAGAVAGAVDRLRRHDVPVVAIDLPSGLDPDRGLAGPCVTADVTVALGAPKAGLRPRVVRPYLGDLYLADLGIPAGAWRAAGAEPVEVFGRGPLVRLVDAVTPPTPNA